MSKNIEDKKTSEIVNIQLKWTALAGGIGEKYNEKKYVIQDNNLIKFFKSSTNATSNFRFCKSYSIRLYGCLIPLIAIRSFTCTIHS